MNSSPLPKLDELLQRLLDDQIAPEEMARLQRVIQDDPQVRDYYINSMLANASLRRSSQATGEFSATDLIEATSASLSQGVPTRVVRWVASMAALLIVGVLLYTVVHYQRERSKGVAIGTLVGGYQTYWRGEQPRLGEGLYSGSYELLDGVAEMRLELGVRLVLEAPCRIHLTPYDEMTLEQGQLVVDVEPEAHGFRVQTTHALITDLGTEFGVKDLDDGRMETHVFKGRVRVALEDNHTARPPAEIVREGYAAHVDVTGRTLRGGLNAQVDEFLLQLPLLNPTSSPSKRIDLADLVGGGDGSGSGQLEQGIDLATGEVLNPSPTEIEWVRQNVYTETPTFYGVDGVFVPNKALGRVVVSSTGLLFSKCPETHGSYYGGAANSGTYRDLVSKTDYTARLLGVGYGSARHPALRLHPNAGITFDLQELRQDNPDFTLSRFTAVCGIPKQIPEPRFSPAQVWILLDGQEVMHLDFPIENPSTQFIDVEIPTGSRFLSLVATCTSRADFSWIVLGDPFLEWDEVLQP